MVNILRKYRFLFSLQLHLFLLLVMSVYAAPNSFKKTVMTARVCIYAVMVKTHNKK